MTYLTRSILRAFLPAFSIVLAATGCTRPEPYGLIDVAGVEAEGPVTSPIAVDVDNRNGTVTVIVDQDAPGPEVTATVPSKQGPALAPEWIAADLIREDGRPVLRVLSIDPEGDSSEFVDLTIRVPACAGVRVRNVGGRVILRNVSGAIDVQSAANSRTAPSITVQTDRPLTLPVLLRTTRGRIDVRIPAESAGRLVVRAPEGLVSVNSGRAALESVAFDRKEWRGVLNRGENEVSLVADEGDVSVVIER